MKVSVVRYIATLSSGAIAMSTFSALAQQIETRVDAPKVQTNRAAPRAPIARLPNGMSKVLMRQPSSAQVADQDVCLFQNANFTGWKFCSNLKNLQVLPLPYQRQLTSIQIPEGFLLKYYRNPDRTGGTCVFYGQVVQVAPECDNMASAISYEPDPEWPAKQAEAQRRRDLQEAQDARQAQERSRQEAAAVTASLTVPVQMLPDLFCFYLELDFKGGGYCDSQTSLRAMQPEIQSRIKSITIERGYRLRLFENTDGTGGSCAFFGQVSPIADGCGEMARAYVYEMDPAFTLSQFLREKQERDRDRGERERDERANKEEQRKRDERDRHRNEFVSSGKCAVSLSTDDADVHPIAIFRAHIAGSNRCANEAAISDVAHANVGIEWNDNIEFVRIENPYVKFTGYEDVNFGGRSITLTCGNFELIDQPENEISSYKIEILDEPVACRGGGTTDIYKWDR
jgi:hypothetical protein